MKFGNHVVKVFNCFMLGEMKLFLKEGEYIYIYIYIYVSNLGGELVCTYIICCYCISVICYVSIFISTHTFDVLF